MLIDRLSPIVEPVISVEWSSQTHLDRQRLSLTFDGATLDLIHLQLPLDCPFLALIVDRNGF